MIKTALYIQSKEKTERELLILTPKGDLLSRYNEFYKHEPFEKRFELVNSFLKQRKQLTEYINFAKFHGYSFKDFVAMIWGDKIDKKSFKSIVQELKNTEKQLTTVVRKKQRKNEDFDLGIPSVYKYITKIESLKNKINTQYRDLWLEHCKTNHIDPDYTIGDIIA